MNFNTQMLHDVLAYHVESFMNILIRIPQHSITKHSHIVVAVFIRFMVFR